ncbi:hypothetical protein MKZ15_06210 [Paenibacillus sp. FSL R7-0216]|uniref:hypothetical protein n=1 Tax=Paenibacillus sp. FSL R7-0216 TaxID=2921677 RepID=UPI0030DB45D4
MTALNFLFTQDAVFIAMDTLSLSDSRKPLKYVSKIFPLLHLRSVMCGTGNLDLILRWYKRIERYVVAKDIDYLSTITQENLQELNSENPKEVTTTIYQFGYSEDRKGFRGFVFRSDKNFELEEYEYCAAMKPKVDINFYKEIEKNGVDDAFIKIMQKQKAEDDNSDIRVGIGGEIHRLTLLKDTANFDIIYKFPGFESQYAEMIKNLQ